MGLKLIPLPGLQIYLGPLVTLIFHLLTTKVDRFVSLLRGLFVAIGIQIGSFLSKYRINKHRNVTHKQINKFAEA